MPTNNTQLPKSFFIIDSSKVFSIEKPVITIGRNLDNDLVLNNPHISRKHAELHFSEGCFLIRDLDSTGGTFVNDEKVSERSLSPGDVVMLTNIHLVFGQEEFFANKDVSQYTPPSHEEQADQETLTNYLRSDD